MLDLLIADMDDHRISNVGLPGQALRRTSGGVTIGNPIVVQPFKDPRRNWPAARDQAWMISYQGPL